MFTFDFLEAAVPGDLPDPLPANPQLSPALDYSTDHTYKLPPARILWAFDQLGYTGPMNEYLGVFWWNERAKDGGSYPECTVEFTGVFAAGDSVWLKIGRQPLGKSVFPGETAQGIANHFMYVINSTLVGVWALAEGNFLRVRARSAAAAYSEYAVTGWVENAAGSTGEVTGGGPMSVGVMGDWQVDPSAEHALNRAATDWHKDFFAQVAARNRRLTTAISMELVNPPAEFSARYPDSSPVITDVGFAALKSTHCAFRSDVRSYQAKVLAEVAVMMADAGLTPDLQCGEFTWWYFTNRTALHPAGGMAYYDSETAAAAQAALGRPLHVFTGPNDDPSVNGGADALFLRNRLRDHVSALMASVRAAVPGTQFEVLFPTTSTTLFQKGYTRSAPAQPLRQPAGRVGIPVEAWTAETRNAQFRRLEPRPGLGKRMPSAAGSTRVAGGEGRVDDTHLQGWIPVVARSRCGTRERLSLH